MDHQAPAKLSQSAMASLPAILALQLQTTAIFDAVGSAIINKIIDLIPNESTIYSYGFLGDDVPLTLFARQILFKGLTIKSFANIRTSTVSDPQQLADALQLMASIIDMPHFKTKVGRLYSLSAIEEALVYAPADISRAVLTFI